MADTEPQTEPNTFADLLDEIENEKLYQALLTVDKHTLLILLLKMQGYSTREIDERMIEKERNEMFYKAVDRLPEIQRRRFLLYYEHDLNFYQIGKMEHCTASAIQKSVSAAREKVKAEMRKYLKP